MLTLGVVVLFLGALACAAAAAFAMVVSKSAVHDAVVGTLLITAAVLFSGACIAGGLRGIQKRLDAIRRILLSRVGAETMPVADAEASNPLTLPLMPAPDPAPIEPRSREGVTLLIMVVVILVAIGAATVAFRFVAK